AVNAEQAEERQQYPRNVVIDGAAAKTQTGLAIHARNQKQIDQPADTQQAKCKKPDRAGDRFAEIKTVRAGEAEYPQQIANGFCVRGAHRRSLGGGGQGASATKMARLGAG